MSETTPLEPVTPPKPPVPARVAIARFITRMWCDSTGQPDTVLVVMPFWLAFVAFFMWEALTAPAAIIEPSVSSIAVTAVQLITLTLILWAAALKLGEGVFVPLASAVAGAFRFVGSAVAGVLAKSRTYAGGPDREVGLTEPGGELHRDAAKPVKVEPAIDPPPMGEDPA